MGPLHQGQESNLQCPLLGFVRLTAGWDANSPHLGMRATRRSRTVFPRLQGGTSPAMLARRSGGVSCTRDLLVMSQVSCDARACARASLLLHPAEPTPGVEPGSPAYETGASPSMLRGHELGSRPPAEHVSWPEVQPYRGAFWASGHHSGAVERVKGIEPP
jgi:hypothetical protein